VTWNHLDDLMSNLTAKVDTYDRAAVVQICEQVSARVRSSDEPFPDEEAAFMLGRLRRKRWFDLMETLADVFIQTGQRSATVRRLHAQALLDQGQLVAGLAIAEQLASETEADGKENAEARGLIGRAYKQMYIDAAAPAVPRNQDFLRKSIDAYYDVYKAMPNPWHGINTVALVARARRDAVSTDGYPEPHELAATILEEIQERADDDRADLWDFATAMEASVGTEDYPGALGWLAKYLATDADSFELSSTLRQLEEVWGFDSSGFQGSILEILRASILRSEDGGAVQLDLQVRADADVSATKAAGVQLERILGSTGVQNLTWYRTGLSRAEAVVLILDGMGSGQGSGFLLSGAELCDALPADEKFVITNAHVVSETYSAAALVPEEAVIKFEALGLDDEYRVAEVIFSSPPVDLDVSVLRIDKPAPSVDPIPIGKRLPVADGEQRVYVIGHPLGGGLSFSLQDNTLLDHEDPLVHYRAPTEPGSSGSPVFNSQWKLIALHHAGGTSIPRLRDQDGVYAANEGLWIQSIRKAIAEDLGSAPSEP
jgi:S1-C subfamily serine protease